MHWPFKTRKEANREPPARSTHICENMTTIKLTTGLKGIMSNYKALREIKYNIQIKRLLRHELNVEVILSYNRRSCEPHFASNSYSFSWVITQPNTHRHDTHICRHSVTYTSISYQDIYHIYIYEIYICISNVHRE